MMPSNSSSSSRKASGICSSLVAWRGLPACGDKRSSLVTAVGQRLLCYAFVAPFVYTAAVEQYQTDVHIVENTLPFCLSHQSEDHRQTRVCLIFTQHGCVLCYSSCYVAKVCIWIYHTIPYFLLYHCCFACLFFISPNLPYSVQHTMCAHWCALAYCPCVVMRTQHTTTTAAVCCFISWETLQCAGDNKRWKALQ